MTVDKADKLCQKSWLKRGVWLLKKVRELEQNSNVKVRKKLKNFSETDAKEIFS